MIYKLNKITLPEHLQIIGACAFWGSNAIDSLFIPQNIKVIRERAFEDSGCKYISIPEKIDSVGDGAFSKFRINKPLIINNELLAFPQAYSSSYSIPENVVAIGDHVFNDCSLSAIVIGENVKRIGSYAFSRCMGLDTIVIPNSVERIPYNCFHF